MEINLQKVNKNAIEACRILQTNGFQAYIVGGCVRDLLLGLEPHDWDITTNAKPENVQALFPINYPTGIQHGTVMVNCNEEHFEITTYRTEGVYFDGRRPSEVQFVENVVEDLARRDLTINAMAFDPIKNELVDPYSGVADLNSKIIRCVGLALERLTEDGLRIMRVARFAARFEYRLDDDTREAMSKALYTLRKISKERIKDELVKLLATKTPSIGLNILKETGVLKEISGLICENSRNTLIPFEKLNNLSESIDMETKLYALYSNVEEHLELELRRLKFSNESVYKVLFLQKMIHNYFNWVSVSSRLSNERYVPLVAFIKNESSDTYNNSLNQLDQYFKFLDPNSSIKEDVANLRVWSKREMLLNGNDLIALGFQPGKIIKECLDAAYQEILTNPERNERAWLIDFARPFLK